MAFRARGILLEVDAVEDERDSRSTSRAAEGVVTAMPQVALLGLVNER